MFISETLNIKSVKRLEPKYAIYMLLGFVAFFFVMKSLGLYTNVNLRVLNILIHGAFAFLAMKAFRENNSEPFDFLSTFGVGFTTSMMAVLSFSLFQFIYLQFLDPTFMEYVNENAIMGSSLTPGLASLVLVIEGFGVSIFTSYVGMRYLTIKEMVPPLT